MMSMICNMLDRMLFQKSVNNQIEQEFKAAFQCDMESNNKSNCHIFQIGFNKCGTRSMQRFLQSNGISSLHHWISNEEWHHNHTFSDPQLLSVKMFDQYINNASLLDDLLLDYTYFGDFGVYLQQYQDHDIIFVNKSAVAYYKVLLQHFPNSVYILNIRNVNNWLRSRYLHYERLKYLYHHGYEYYDKIYIDKIKMIGGNDIYDKYSDYNLLQQWKTLWYQYLCDVIRYFDRMNMMNRIIIFDIEQDDIQGLIEFFDSYGIELDESYWNSYGKTNYSQQYHMIVINSGYC